MNTEISQALQNLIRDIKNQDSIDNSLIADIMKCNRLTEKDVASVCGDLTHMMGNSGETNFTTLHIYGSNSVRNKVSPNAKVYMPEFQKLVTTMGSAYLNMAKDLIISEKPLNNINADVLTDYFSLVKPFYKRNNNKAILGKLEHYLNH